MIRSDIRFIAQLGILLLAIFFLALRIILYRVPRAAGRRLIENGRYLLHRAPAYEEPPLFI